MNKRQRKKQRTLSNFHHVKAFGPEFLPQIARKLKPKLLRKAVRLYKKDQAIWRAIFAGILDFEDVTTTFLRAMGEGGDSIGFKVEGRLSEE